MRPPTQSSPHPKATSVSYGQMVGLTIPSHNAISKPQTSHSIGQVSSMKVWSNKMNHLTSSVRCSLHLIARDFSEYRVDDFLGELGVGHVVFNLLILK